MIDATDETPRVPDHVPPELVRSSQGFDDVASDWRNPFADTENVFKADYPPIFFVPGYPIPIVGSTALGTWMITRHDDIREVYQTPAIFSSHGIAGYQHLAGEDWEMLPLSVDAPPAQALSIAAGCVGVAQGRKCDGRHDPFAGEFAHRTTSSTGASANSLASSGARFQSPSSCG